MTFPAEGAVFLQLHPDSKAPAAAKWSSPTYKGIDPSKHARVGLRCDGLVVIDCDSALAAKQWRSRTDNTPTREHSTPRGFHFFYTFTPGSPSTPSAGALPGIDVRAGRGSQVVFPPTDGYKVVKKNQPAPFRPEWLPQTASTTGSNEMLDWEVIPEGFRNDTLTAFAGAFRRQGMSPEMIYKALLGLNEGICEPPLAASEIETIVRSAARYEPQPDWSIDIELETDDLLLWMKDMTLPPPPTWLWRPYIPEGRLVLLDGSEGIGKGLFCAWLATRVADERTVLWMSTEDDPEEDIQRRLLAAGYDRKESHPIGFFVVDPRFPAHIDMLESAILDHSAQLVIMDPGRSFLSGQGKEMSYNNEADIRPGLEALNKLAKRTDCTIIFVHHWNKNTATTVQYRSGGSGSFAQVVRHRLTLAWHGPTEGGAGAFEISKSNIGPRGHVHGYEIVANVEYDTATFKLTEPLLVPDLNAWMDAMESKANDIEIDEGDDDGPSATEAAAEVAERLKVTRGRARKH